MGEQRKPERFFQPDKFERKLVKKLQMPGADSGGGGDYGD